jgi:mono/diheme cytochrome c family protein
MLRHEGEWTGYSFAWNAEQTDAVRMPAAGETRKLESGRDWRFPSKQECVLCHTRQAGFVLGATTGQLNRAGADGENQLERFEKLGWLKVNPALSAEGDWRKEVAAMDSTPEEKARLLALVGVTPWQRQPVKDSPMLAKSPDKLPRLANPYDDTAPLADRARSYLHTNCAHCHMHNAGGNSQFLTASHLGEKEMNLRNGVPLHGSFGMPDARLVAPGEPGRSVMIYRTAVRGEGQMPPVGTLMPDAKGVELLAQWIAAMDKDPAKDAVTAPKQ